MGERTDVHLDASSGAGEVFLVFLKLGLTSFGGPVAHLGYFREEFVIRRKWLDERAYADLVALCQFLPGPASSRVGLAVGLSRAGYLGALRGLDWLQPAVGPCTGGVRPLGSDGMEALGCMVSRSPPWRSSRKRFSA